MKLSYAPSGSESYELQRLVLIDRLLSEKEKQNPQTTAKPGRTDQIPFCPCRPQPKQETFLGLSCLEALFGGAAGGGKSICLLMAALQYVEVPRYRALLLRRTFADLSKPDSLMYTADEWLRPTAARWTQHNHTWNFPSGATLTFGYLDHERDTQKYKGPGFQFIGWDELTEFTEGMYRYMFTRMRRPQGSAVPTRMRAASNPDGIGHCVPYGEVLTPSGWRDIKSFAVGDPVYTVQSDGAMTRSTVEQVHRSEYHGDMMTVSQRGFHLACTPNHRVAKLGGRRQGLNTREGSRQLFSLVPFENLPGQASLLRSVRWEGTPVPDFQPATVATRARKLRQPAVIPGRLFAALFGWFITEGSTVDRDKAFAISQEKPVQTAAIASLLDLCGFRSTRTGAQWIVYAPDWWGYFRQFGKCRQKFIPDILKAGTPDDLRALFLAMVDGDGHWSRRGESGQFYSTSGRLADDFAEVAVKLGLIVHISSRQRDDREGPCYCVNFRATETGGTEISTGQHVYDVDTTTKRSADVDRKPFSGTVYCLGIPETHSFIIRQKGSVWVSGNSWVKERFITPGSETERVFVPSRLSDNAYVDAEEYIKTFEQTDPVTRRQLLEGDWDVRPEGKLFKREWFQIVEAGPA